MFCLFLISSYLLLPPLFKSPILSPPTFPSDVQTEKLSCFLSGKIPSLELIQGTLLVQPLRKTVWRFLKKLEIELPYDPAIPLLGIHTK